MAVRQAPRTSRDGQLRPPREYVTGEGFPYLGRSYRLLLVHEAHQAVRLHRGRLELRRDAASDGARSLTRWYRQIGEPWLRKRIAPWAQRMNVEVTALRVLPLGYRWGSCSPDGKLNIHWAALQLPPDLVDYVLVHELAHLHRRDHGPEFWRIVELAMPDSTPVATAFAVSVPTSGFPRPDNASACHTAGSASARLAPRSALQVDDIDAIARWESSANPGSWRPPPAAAIRAGADARGRQGRA